MADFAPELPLDLINKVLIRLPAKSVGRFRCVSKLWRSHLSNPRFMKSHRNFHIHNSPRSIIVSVTPGDACYKCPFFLTSADGASYIIVKVPPKTSSDQFPHLLTIPTNGVDGTSRKVTSPLFSRQKGWIRVGAECHGFVLVLQREKGKMFVFNPVTLDALEVPRFPLPKNFGIRECQFGMGYDSTSDDYKIVMLSYYSHWKYDKYDGTYVHVYSLKMNTWRRVANSPFNHNTIHPHPVGCTNGRLLWQAEMHTEDGRKMRRRPVNVIAAFNLAQEEFERVPPPTKQFERTNGELSVLGGCLAVECPNAWGLISIWVMKEYGVPESWKNVVTCIDENQFATCACPAREDEILCKHIIDKDKFSAYSLSTGLWREFSVHGTPELSGCVKWLMTFTECLLSPNNVADEEGENNDFYA